MHIRCLWVYQGVSLLLRGNFELDYTGDNEATSGLCAGGLVALHIDMSLCKYRTASRR